MIFPYDFRTDEQKDIDEHYQAFRDGDNNDCTCSLCTFWREQESRDLENV